MKALPIEPTTSELVAEILERLPADRLCTIECHRPAAEVEFVDLIFADAAHAQVIRKVGAAAAGRAMAADGLQPTHRAWQDRHRGHQRDRESCAKRLENSSNQSHVVVWRQPEHGGA